MMTAITRARMVRSLFTGLAAGLLTGQVVAQTGKKHRSFFTSIKVTRR
jgi:hypothetical protein